MASSVIFEERVEIRYFRSLAEFRAWALSDGFPERGRIDYIGGRIEVDMSPENLFFHGSIKTEVVGELRDEKRRKTVRNDLLKLSDPFLHREATADADGRRHVLVGAKPGWVSESEFQRLRSLLRSTIRPAVPEPPNNPFPRK